MNNALLVSIGFGIVAIAMMFLIVVFGRAYLDPAQHFDRRYRVVSASLTVSAAGVLLWSFNPLMQALGGSPLHPYLMFLASALILTSAAATIGSTAIGGARETLAWFVATSVVWTLLCIVWSLI